MVSPPLVSAYHGNKQNKHKEDGRPCKNVVKNSAMHTNAIDGVRETSLVLKNTDAAEIHCSSFR
jgi:hypothetical protein